MNELQLHEISEESHRILNPFSAEKLRLLGEVCRLEAGMRQLDLACGKGEMLCTWAAERGITGTGVDISSVFIPAARARAQELGVSDRVTFTLADASDYDAGDAGFDVVSCIGATWIGGGIEGTIRLMQRPLAAGGLMLVGEPFWREEPPESAYAAVGCAPGDFTSLAGTQRRIESTGMSLVEMVLADEDSWDRYEAAQWWTLTAWLEANRESADAPEVRGILERSRRGYLEFGRRYLGWGVFVLRAP